MLKGKGEDASAVMAEVAGLGDALKAGEDGAGGIDAALRYLPRTDSQPAARKRAGRQGRKRQRRSAALGHAARHRRAARPRRSRHRAGRAGFRGGGQNFRQPLHRDEGPDRSPASCADPVHARPAYRRAWLHRGLYALPGQSRKHVRHRPAAQVRGRPVHGADAATAASST